MRGEIGGERREVEYSESQIPSNKQHLNKEGKQQLSTTQECQAKNVYTYIHKQNEGKP